MDVNWDTAWRIFGMQNLGQQKIIRNTKMPDAGIPMGHQLKILISRPHHNVKLCTKFSEQMVLFGGCRLFIKKSGYPENPENWQAFLF